MGWLIFVGAIIVFAFLVIHFRDEISEWFPGFKTYLWNLLVFAGGLLTEIIDPLKEFAGAFGNSNVTSVIMALAVVGIALSYVTKREN